MPKLGMVMKAVIAKTASGTLGIWRTTASNSKRIRASVPLTGNLICDKEGQRRTIVIVKIVLKIQFLQTLYKTLIFVP